jgi:Ras-related protein Rab-1A
MATYDYLFKLLIIGDAGVGKSALLTRYCDGTFSGGYLATIGVDFKTKTINVDGKSVKLQVWDTAGQERFRTITSTYYRGAHGIVVVYDSTNKASLDSVKNWMAEIDRFASPQCARILVATKCDLETMRQVSSAEGKKFSESMNVPFAESSAKEDMNVSSSFELLAANILTNMKNNPTPAKAPTLLSQSSSSASLNKQKCGCK